MKLLLEFLNDIKGSSELLALHEPTFESTDIESVTDCIRSTFVSSVGEIINEFGKKLSQKTGFKFISLTSSGTTALHLMFESYDDKNCEILVPGISFVATANAVLHSGNIPHFIDISPCTGMVDPEDLRLYLRTICQVKNQQTYNKHTGRKILCLVAVDFLGNPCAGEEIKAVCSEFGIGFMMDCAESLGSFRKGEHTGVYADAAALSFNGNKIITTGSGGAVLTNSESLYRKISHRATTAKLPIAHEFIHDELGYNYRMAALNAALGSSQIDRLDIYLNRKNKLYHKLKQLSTQTEQWSLYPHSNGSNKWLNGVRFRNANLAKSFIEISNQNQIQTRRLWQPLMLNKHLQDYPAQKQMINSRNIYHDFVCIPSSPSIIV